MIEFVGKTVTPVVYNLIWYAPINVVQCLLTFAQFHHVTFRQQGHRGED